MLAVVEVVEEGWRDIEEYGKVEREKEKERGRARKVGDEGVMKKNLSVEEEMAAKRSDNDHEISK